MKSGGGRAAEYVGISTRFVGIKRAAQELAVNENHLRMVLRGDRVSQRLTERVRQRFPALLAAPAGKAKVRA